MTMETRGHLLVITGGEDKEPGREGGRDGRGGGRNEGREGVEGKEGREIVRALTSVTLHLPR